MIPLRTSDPVLARFARDLDELDPQGITDLDLDVSKYATEDIEVAQLLWSQRVMGEYRGVVIYAELLSTLIEAEAPYAAIAAVQRILGDELRHTRLAALVVERLGGWESLHLDLGGQRMPRLEGPACARALEIAARELVVVEEDSVHRLRAYLRAPLDPAIRGVVESLLRDEVRHAAAGRSLVALIEGAYPASDLSTTQARLKERLPLERKHLRDVAFAHATGGPGRALGACLSQEDLRDYPEE